MDPYEREEAHGSWEVVHPYSLVEEGLPYVQEVASATLVEPTITAAIVASAYFLNETI